MRKIILLITSLLQFAFFSKAGIVYTDIAPDATKKLSGSEPSWFKIDFNTDGTEEYNFRWDFYPPDFYVHCTNKTPSNKIACDGTINAYGAPYGEVINAGTLIDNTMKWEASFPEPLITDSDKANFSGKGDKYIGVQFMIGSNLHYGWILINYTSGHELTVKGYAYDNTPNTPIKAGDMGSAVPGKPAAGFNASLTATDNKTTVTFTDISTNTPTGWQWTFTPNTVTYKGGTSATSKNPQVQFTAIGKYSVKLKATNASGSDSLTKANYITISPSASIEHNETESNAFKVFPNPSKGSLLIETMSGKGTLDFMDLNGKLEWSQVIEAKKTQVDISHLPAGVHTIRLNTLNGAVIKKIILE